MTSPRNKRTTSKRRLYRPAVALAALGLVLLSFAITSSAAEPPLTLAVTNGYDTKSGKTLVADGKLSVVTQSDSNRYGVEAGHRLSFAFQGSVPAGATIGSTRIFVERYEESDFSGALSWQAGGGSLTAPTIAQNFSPAPLRGESAETWSSGT